MYHEKPILDGLTVKNYILNKIFKKSMTASFKPFQCIFEAIVHFFSTKAEHIEFQKSGTEMALLAIEKNSKIIFLVLKRKKTEIYLKIISFRTLEYFPNEK